MPEKRSNVAAVAGRRREASPLRVAASALEQPGLVVPLRDRHFRLLSGILEERVGLHLSAHKVVMLQARLQKRLRELSLRSFDDYIDHLLSSDGEQEMSRMVDVATTHKTEFFRERSHFDLLTDTILPELARTALARGERLEVWSAGCSTGEEAWTLAMVLAEAAEQHPGLDFRVLGTDVSEAVVKKAREAVYDLDRVEPVPAPLLRKYLMRSRNRAAKLVRVVPELRAKVEFRVLNLLETAALPLFHIIFCRNVMIYFDAPTRRRVIELLVRQLRGPRGHLFVGHAETLAGLSLPLAGVAPSAYVLASGRDEP